MRLLTRRTPIRTRTALGYLLAIARNACLTRMRRRRREVPLVSDLFTEEIDPGRRREGEARLGVALHALARLPEGERAALLLRVDHELPYEEIAAALEISVAAAKVRVHRARLRLAAALQEEENRS